MKKTTITLMVLAIASLKGNAQNHIETFEGFTLPSNSAYTNTNSIAFDGVSKSFEHKYDTAFNFWKGGFAYTNKYDSSTAGYSNLYGVKPYKGYNGSNMYTVGQNKGTIKLKSPYKGVEGMYITNTTYAYKSMLLGDAFAKKFGGPSGNDPDWFKITIKGFRNGSMKSDSVEFYLADFRFSNNAQDYIVSSWQWVNTMSLGEVDSIRFYMYSSDVGQFGINTPLFFGIDNITSSASFVGLTDWSGTESSHVYPNPAKDAVYVKHLENSETEYCILNIDGKIIQQGYISKNNHRLNVSEFPSGVYILRFQNGNRQETHKIIKN